ncbi:uncharacterized protein VDAG_04856 [Verticillium dahliae VdLs.17]|uniref:Uncharacterized protein n=1 Tax=Verticillium dahliae (strain VdLs.17 / ATCC MYA-4575 / FGSC 10137) TaxID=498257 RepID=G2X371_VERDV|nr:uncharacterized protein VDAG_04856 [Verticillium dahliae VdLs.17]EGY23418.1 hypothetical protein VDAG_04856 [Verticillium dahliae VdLs.17]
MIDRGLGDFHTMSVARRALQMLWPWTSPSPQSNTSHEPPLPSIEYIPVHGAWEKKDHPNWPASAFKIPDVIKPGQVFYLRKGKFVDMGTIARIELLPTGEVVKTPLENPLNPREEQMNRDNMQYENEIYRLLGDVSFVPKLLGWDSASCTLTLEHQTNGSLDDRKACFPERPGIEVSGARVDAA